MFCSELLEVLQTKFEATRADQTHKNLGWPQNVLRTYVALSNKGRHKIFSISSFSFSLSFFLFFSLCLFLSFRSLFLSFFYFFISVLSSPFLSSSLDRRRYLMMGKTENGLICHLQLYIRFELTSGPFERKKRSEKGDEKKDHFLCLLAWLLSFIIKKVRNT